MFAVICGVFLCTYSYALYYRLAQYDYRAVVANDGTYIAENYGRPAETFILK